MVKVVLVDEKDNVVGLEDKVKAHKNPVPLHRAISVLIYSKDRKKMLLQKRAKGKPTWPLFWSNTTCTHPLEGESYKDAAIRRLKEEMGIETELSEILKFTYKDEFDETWGEHEYDVVFEGTYDGLIDPDPEEAADHKWMDTVELKRDIKSSPDSYTPWFKIIMDKIS